MVSPLNNTNNKSEQTVDYNKKQSKETEQSKDSKKTEKTNNSFSKEKHYSVGPDGKKIDVTSVFDEIEKNSKDDQKRQDQFMHDMFGDVLN